MKYVPSIAFEEMSGSAKGVTAAKTRGRKYIRNRGYGGNTRTEFQSSVKSVFKQLSQAWQGLTNAQILAWNSAAGSAEAKSVLGSKTKISGSNLFMRLNYWVVYCGGNILTTPPVLGGVDAPSEAVITLTADKFTFELEYAPAAAADLRLIVQASAPQSNGVTRAYAKAATIGGARACSTDEIDIKADYDEKNGAPSAAAPKVFMKYFFVNTKTGEKSGEMMAIAKL